MDQTALFYSRPSSDYRGGGFPVFAGSRRQRGGGIFGSLKKMFMPAVKNIGKSLFSHGLGLARDVAADAMTGKNLKESLINHGKSHAKAIGKNALLEAASMIGKGGRRVSRKRKRRAKSKPKRKAKRRRTGKANF